jgi:hypothetical protein
MTLSSSTPLSPNTNIQTPVNRSLSGIPSWQLERRNLPGNNAFNVNNKQESTSSLPISSTATTIENNLPVNNPTDKSDPYSVMLKEQQKPTSINNNPNPSPPSSSSSGNFILC